MLARRLRRRRNIQTTVAQRLMFAWYEQGNKMHQRKQVNKNRVIVPWELKSYLLPKHSNEFLWQIGRSSSEGVLKGKFTSHSPDKMPHKAWVQARKHFAYDLYKNMVVWLCSGENRPITGVVGTILDLNNYGDWRAGTALAGFNTTFLSECRSNVSEFPHLGNVVYVLFNWFYAV